MVGRTPPTFSCQRAWWRLKRSQLRRRRFPQRWGNSMQSPAGGSGQDWGGANWRVRDSSRGEGILQSPIKGSGGDGGASWGGGGDSPRGEGIFSNRMGAYIEFFNQRAWWRFPQRWGNFQLRQGDFFFLSPNPLAIGPGGDLGRAKWKWNPSKFSQRSPKEIFLFSFQEYLKCSSISRQWKRAARGGGCASVIFLRFLCGMNDSSPLAKHLG